VNADADVALAAAATLVAGAFSLSTLDRYLRRGTRHELAWTVSLVLFATGSAALWWAESVGWSNASFRLFYLAGAVLNVPWLALGTVYLLGGRRVGDRLRWGLAVLSGVATGAVLFGPLHQDVAGDEMPSGRDVFGVAPRVMAAVGSGVAALVIIAGALYSATRLRRGDPWMMGGNVLIATGTVILSLSGSLAGRLGKDRAFAVTLVVGIVVLFAGFLVAGGRRARVASAPPTRA
jgi:hypothetical protein